MSKDSPQRKMLSSFYNDMKVLRSLISSVPYIGNLLDLTLSQPGQKFVEERLEYLIEELRNELEQVEEAVIDNTFLQTEEGYDLIIRAFSAAARTRQREKLKLFSKVLRGAYTHKKINHDPELYIKIIDELNERELQVAYIIYDIKIKKSIVPKEDESGNDIHFISRHFPDFAEGDLEFILPRLEKTGLIKELVGTFMGYIGGTYNPTPYLSAFIDYIENNE